MNTFRVFHSTGFQDQVPAASQGPASPAQAPLHHQEAKNILLKCMFAVLLIGKLKKEKSTKLNFCLDDLFIYFFQMGKGYVL